MNENSFAFSSKGFPLCLYPKIWVSFTLTHHHHPCDQGMVQIAPFFFPLNIIYSILENLRRGGCLRNPNPVYMHESIIEAPNHQLHFISLHLPNRPYHSPSFSSWTEWSALLVSTPLSSSSSGVVQALDNEGQCLGPSILWSLIFHALPILQILNSKSTFVN